MGFSLDPLQAPKQNTYTIFMSNVRYLETKVRKSARSVTKFLQTVFERLKKYANLLLMLPRRTNTTPGTPYTVYLLSKCVCELIYPLLECGVRYC